MRRNAVVDRAHRPAAMTKALRSMNTLHLRWSATNSAMVMVDLAA